MIRALQVLVLALVVTPACGRKRESGADRAIMMNEQAARVSVPPAAAPMPAVAQAAPPPAPASPGQVPSVAVPRMLTRTGRVTIRVDKLDAGMRAVRTIAQRVGGYVAGESVQAGENELRQGTLQLKVPSARFDEALAALNGVGKVESAEVTSEDVGQEYVDVNARLANSRRLEQRLLTLLETRTGKLEDVLAVERELARVREEIERMTARVQYLQQQVAVSTLTVTVHEPAPLTGAPGSNQIVEAFRQAWRNFVEFVAGFIAFLGVLIPLLALIALVWWAAGRRWYRRRRNAPPASPSQNPNP